MFRASMFRPAAALPHARVIPTHPQVMYKRPNHWPRPRHCPPGEVWGYWPALQSWICGPPGHPVGPHTGGW
jgi:hypothetical protein